MEYQYLVHRVYSPGRHVPAWGMAPGVYGCGDVIGWQVLGLRVHRRRLRVSYASWIYPTEEAALAHLKRLRRQQRALARKKP